LKTKAVIRCFAKINLFLDVLGKRPDGYHNIETIFQTVSLGDVLEIELTSSEIVLECNDPRVPLDAANLVLKAFHTISHIAEYTGGIRIRIDKNIPPGAGLGGGSSNAAATLVALNRLLHANIPEPPLHELARGLGADVSFFLTGGLAVAWQRGDRFAPLPSMSESRVIVAVPRHITVATGEAYAMLDVPEFTAAMPESLMDCTPRLQRIVNALDTSTPLSENEDANAILYNAFERPVFARYPEIARIKESLIASGAPLSLMSGSGSALFALTKSHDQALTVKTAVEKSANAVCHIVKTTDCAYKWEDA
jgi:4-diphosphocytidyl-2-C-methyl-D-erythritol kinase